MYQSVDDNDEAAHKPEEKPGRAKLASILLIGIALIALIAFFLPKEAPIESEDVESGEEIYSVYTRALSEPLPALRRARLLDFVGNYPEHDRVDAAKAQLAVIQKSDDEAWLSLQEIIYDPKQSRPMKLAALDLYDELWSSILLGGREQEVLDLRARLESDKPLFEETIETPENELVKEDFTPEPDVFDSSIDSTQLAGGAPVFEPIRRPAPPSTAVVTERPNTAVIVPARIRKDRKPSYPSRASRRGVEAEIVLLLNVDDEGEVQMTEVLSARAPRYRRDFIRAAERAALRTKYYPKTVNGRPVASTGIIKKYVFQME